MTPSPSTAETPVAWGSVGSSNTWGYLADSSDQGVTRAVEPNVRYTRPPAFVEPAWVAVDDQPDRFQMPWPRPPAESVRTLADLGEALRKKQAQGTLSANDPDLAELDAVGVQLVRLADRLREAGWRPGLLHPRNVLVPRGRGGQALVLPDLGFVWEGGMMMPAWVSDREFAALYDGDPAALQKASPGGTSLDPLDPKADVPHLARLLACVLTGTPRRDLARPADTSGGPTTKEQLWDVLARASRGHLDSLDDFARRLADTRLRSHFVPQRLIVSDAAPARSGALPVILGIITVLIVGVAAVLFWRPWEAGTHVAANDTGKTTPPPPTSAATNPAPPAGPAADWLKQLRMASPDEQAKIFEAALGAGVPEETRRQNAQAYFADWKARLDRLLEESRDPSKFFAAADGLRHLQQEMSARQKVTATPLDAEEQRCLEDLQVYLAQLGFLR